MTRAGVRALRGASPLLALLLLAGPVRGQAIPPDGVRAEAEGRWDDARAAYRAALAEDPEWAELWRRLADVEAAAGRTAAAAEALERAASLRPGDRDLQASLSRAWAMADRPREALKAVERALAIRPDAELHRARASLATWAGDYAAAEESYRWLEARGEPSATLGRARIAAWEGRVGDAIEAYDRYRERAPDDPEPVLELARQHTWSGAAGRALEVLAGYEARFGATDGYRIERARALVTGNRPRAALQELEVVRDDSPEAYEAGLVRVLALAAADRPVAALRAADALDRLDPGNPRTGEVRRLVRAPIRPSVETRFGYGSDTDDIERLEAGVRIGIEMSPSVGLVLDVASIDLRSDGLPGLAPVEGSTDRDRFEGSLGLTARGRGARFTGRIGTARVGGDGPDLVTFAAGVTVAPDDAVRFDAGMSRAFHDVSPRAVELGIERVRGRLGLGLFPAPGWSAELDGAWDDFSDGNRRLEAGATVRRAVVRGGRANVDLGLRTRWSGFEEDLDHGYYDPASAWRHTVTVSTYWKLAPAHGLSLGGAAGAYRDDATGGYEPSGEAYANATFGILSDWTLVVTGAWMKNTRVGSGAYSAVGSSVALTRRF